MSQPKRDKYSTGSNQKFFYVRLGIYEDYRHRRHPREPYRTYQVNFCDLHFQRLLLRGSYLEGFYTGAKDSISQITSRRTEKDEEKLLATGEVDERNRLSNGGRMSLFLNTKTSDYECWLFGPLWFGQYTLGSLLLKLSGLQLPVMWTRQGDGQKKETTSWVDFPEGFGMSRGRCTLWGSYYTDGGALGSIGGGGRPMWPDEFEKLRKQRKHVFPVDTKTRYTWKVEAHFGNLRFNEMLHQRDTTRHKFRNPSV